MSSTGVRAMSTFRSTVSTMVFSLWMAETSGVMYCSCFSLGMGRLRMRKAVCSFHPSWSSTWATRVSSLGYTVLVTMRSWADLFLMVMF